LTGIVFAIAGASFADNVQNDVIPGGSDTFTAGGSTIVGYRITANNGDGQTGCNASDGSAATVTINAPTGVTPSPASLSFTTCGTAKNVTFTSNTPGAYNITVSVSDSGAGTYNTTPAAFTLHVNAPVVTNHAPVLTVPSAGLTAEATSDSGANVTYSGISATDQEDGNLTSSVQCTPASGSLFAIGTAPVNCSVTDSGGLSDSGFFSVTVQDTTKPTLNLPSDITAEATGPSGAAVTYNASASDLVDGPVAVTCTPASGSTFALGTTPVNCSATDAHGNKATGSFDVTVQDTTAPSLSVPADIIKEATSAAGAAVSFVTGASDAVDSTPTIICKVGSNPVQSGDTFPLGTTTVSCTASDDAGNTSAPESFTITVRDTTAPSLSVPADITNEATSAAGAVVNFSTSASDLVDGSVPVNCDASSGDTFPLGVTTVHCSATDAHGNSASGSFKITVQDTTPPSLSLPSNITTTAPSNSSKVVNYSASATDLVDGAVAITCSPASGSSFAVGTTTVSCSATDAHNNTANGSFTVTVNYSWTGFFQPIDNGVMNVAKAGSTIPVKFSLGGDQGLNIFYSSAYPNSGSISCAADPSTDAIEEYSTATVSGLKYDPTANQYIYNWKTASNYAGTCRQLIVRLADGTYHRADFKFTK
jgi:hypothetical protein